MFNNFNLLKEFGSPLYAYDYSILKDRCNKMKNFSNTLKNGLSNQVAVNMHYSTKANGNPTILAVVRESGLNIDCMSPLELALNEKSGFTSDRMLYVCNNVSSDEMRLVYEKGILICLDSVSQVETWGKMFPGTDIMVRINPGVIGVGHSDKVITSGKTTKFGISEENLPALLDTAKKYDLNIIGTHQHLGSLFLNDKIPDYIAGIKAGLEIVKKYFSNIKIVDLGGGFGVPYLPTEEDLDLDKLSQELLPILNEFIKCYPSVKEFKFEPGRYIPCESGSLIGTVTAVKHENDTWWVCTDIGMNQLIRPSMYQSYHEIEVIHQNNNDKKPEIVANFCGNVCESGDILGKNRLITLPEVGDVVIVRNSGAYGFSMASNYTGRLRPAEIMIDNNECKLIRKRETTESLLANVIL